MVWQLGCGDRQGNISRGNCWLSLRGWLIHGAIESVQRLDLVGIKPWAERASP